MGGVLSTRYRLRQTGLFIVGPAFPGTIVRHGEFIARRAENEVLPMSATGLDVFDKTLQTTNIWLKEITATLGPDRQLAWKVLSVVLHKLRDRLPGDLSAHLAAELPLLVRGVYYDQFEPTRQPTEMALPDFVDEVADWLSDARRVDPKDAIRAVLSVLSRHVPRGQIGKVQKALPQDIRSFWLAIEEEMAEAMPAAG
jgi:uncharacterized protein (DUF2267 family)